MINRLIKKVILKDQMVKEFVPTGVREGQVAEKVFISFDEQQTWIDVTNLQCLAADGGFEATGIGLPALRKK